MFSNFLNNCTVKTNKENRMTIVSTSYSKTESFSNAADWLHRIDFYTGILEALAGNHKVCSIERINYEGFIEKNGVSYYFMLLRNKIVHWPWRMHRLIKELGPDVVLVNGFIFPLQIIQLKLKLGSKVKILILHRAEKPSGGLKKILQKIADRYVDGYLFTSAEAGKDWVRKKIISNENKIHEVIQASSHFKPGNRSMARAKLNMKQSPAWLWVGRLDENKDPATVIKAFRKFLQICPHAMIYMIFHEEKLLVPLKNLIEIDPVAANSIVFVGKVPHKELEDWFNACDFLISASHYEGSGIAVCEGMSCGCIPIVTRIPSFTKMLGPGRCGRMFEAGNEEDLLCALKESVFMDVDHERQRTIFQFEKELSFQAIARKIESLVI
jgi:glycosyltransferase involved in cell wall biosynthesis